jgi:hypothetical protein|tara:strand:- start:300 stop:401 length:102 start_codon:yes stop_codon:yes gene_type:complete
MSIEAAGLLQVGTGMLNAFPTGLLLKRKIGEYP